MKAQPFHVFDKKSYTAEEVAKLLDEAEEYRQKTITSLLKRIDKLTKKMRELERSYEC